MKLVILLFLLEKFFHVSTFDVLFVLQTKLVELEVEFRDFIVLFEQLVAQFLVVLLDIGQLIAYSFDLLLIMRLLELPFFNILVLVLNDCLKPLNFLFEPFNFSQISLVLPDGLFQSGYFLFKLMNFVLFRTEIASESA